MYFSSEDFSFYRKRASKRPRERERERKHTPHRKNVIRILEKCHCSVIVPGWKKYPRGVMSSGRRRKRARKCFEASVPEENIEVARGSLCGNPV